MTEDKPILFTCQMKMNFGHNLYQLWKKNFMTHFAQMNMTTDAYNTWYICLMCSFNRPYFVSKFLTQ